MLIATLGSEGWIDDASMMGDKLFAYLITSNKSQSILFNNKVMSFQDMLSRLPKERRAIQEGVRTLFNDYYTRFFDNVDVQCICDEPPDTGTFVLYITVLYVYKGVTYSLGRQLADIHSSAIKVIDYNNTGTL